ncbi:MULTISPECIES: chaplin [unclassified Streptomyces]|uniref:chaplin n=1 Tax=unclassified Streptomyces TaxID=2593676 RepID=UPI002DD7C63C|nr:chaplin [Streptomyces sp. NBC_00151]WRZ41682.1 chaplin [Streptomyces sp. NBC_00151]
MSRIAKAAAVVVGTGAVALSGAGMAMADAGAQGGAVGSPGVLSGNVIQAPIHIPVNLCGNTINVIGLLNPAFGNTCVNGDADLKEHKAGKKHGSKKHHEVKKHHETRGYGN